MKRIVLIGGLLAGLTAGTAGVALAAAGGSPNTAQEDREQAAFTERHRSEATVSEQEAVRTALAQHPGTATDVHLEAEDGPLVWEVKPDDGSTLWEVQVDARTGRVISDQHDE
jgi:uncharacterized membrane protein YkoI